MGEQFKRLAWELERRTPWLATSLCLVTLCLWVSALPWQRENLPLASADAVGTGGPGLASAGLMVRARVQALVLSLVNIPQPSFKEVSLLGW